MIIQTLSNLVGHKVEDLSVIIQGFTGSPKSGSMTGTLIATNNVYSISQGRVIDVRKDENGLYCITVQYAPDKWFRYCLIESTTFNSGMPVYTGNKLGQAHKGQIRFEYATLEESLYPIRLHDRVFYKHDPTNVLLARSYEDL